MVELVLLRVVERVALGAEIRARIDHPRVEPKPVERVRHVVVVLNVRAVTPAAMPDSPNACAQRMAACRDRAGHRFGDGQRALCAAGEIDILMDVRAGERA